ncbi:MAG: uroporphyrinogen-III synthase, partial [Proteobacteria bacterium]|nr:uroporphyrinogen-III synthase [Pseudomonadota bacterium]
IVVASARAAEAIVETIVEAGGSRSPIWAVGPATARVFAAAGLAVRTPADARDALTLAHAVLATHPRRVLAPRAEAGREEGLVALRAAGVIVDELIAYRTLPRGADDPLVAHGRAVLLAGEAALCGVFAPSQVAALAAIVGPLAALTTRFVAIGHTTAQALREVGVDAIVAATPTPAAMATAIAAVYPSSR